MCKRYSVTCPTFLKRLDLQNKQTKKFMIINKIKGLLLVVFEKISLKRYEKGLVNMKVNFKYKYCAKEL